MLERPTRTLAERVTQLALPLYWITLFAATHYPRVPVPTGSGRDKIVHFLAFGLLAVLYWLFMSLRRPPGPRFVWASAVVLIAYAAIDEYLQQFFGRYTELPDFVANSCGIVVALVWLEVRRRRRERHTAGT